MKYRFEVNLNDNDYIAYNQFYMINSKSGKQSIAGFRIILSVVLGLVIAVLMIAKGFTLDSLIDVSPYVILLILCHVFLKKYFAWSAKIAVKNAKKNGKAAYSPHTVFEFYDDYFVSIDDYSRTEQKYSVIEAVSVIRGKYVYIHLNSVASQIITYSAFESEEQYKDFLYFMSGLCGGIDYYDGVK